MTTPIEFANEPESNRAREAIAHDEPVGQRTFTPTQAVLSQGAGLYLWTPDGRRLADFTSGVLVANLGHNPRDWLERWGRRLGWSRSTFSGGQGFAEHCPMTAYNAITPLEVEANVRLRASLRRSPGGARLESVLWAASGSEAVQKALWASLRFQPTKDVILATRGGFHGKKGLAGAVTGDEHSPDRDPRVHFVSFPKRECDDVALRGQSVDLAPYARELEGLADRFEGRLNCLITEPYLGGGGSFHPPPEYLQLLERFCRTNDAIFILDEVQSNFGRTGHLFAFETYGVEPDIVALGKGMGNGVPVNAAVGRADVLGALGFGEGSDTWSAHPLGCAAVLATLDVFEATDVIGHARRVSERVARGLRDLKELDLVRAVRGEGMVWGVEINEVGTTSSQQAAIACVEAAYLGDDEGNAIHLLGPLAGNVLRVSPPLTMTLDEADFWMDVFHRILKNLERRLRLGRA